MNANRIDHIAAQAKQYAKMETLPVEIAAKLPGKYVEDVPFLLGEVQQLMRDNKVLMHILSEKDEQLNAVEVKLQQLARRLKCMAEKCDASGNDHTILRAVKDRKTRTTDNRPPA